MPRSGWRADRGYQRLNEPPLLPQGLRRRRPHHRATPARVERRRRRGRRAIGVYSQRVPAHRARQHRHGDLQAHRIRPGPLHRHRHRACRRDRRRLGADQGRVGASRRDAIFQFRLRQGAGNRRLDRYGQLLGAAPPGRSRGPRAPHCGGCQDLERRSRQHHHREGHRQRRGRPVLPALASSLGLRSRSSCPGRSSRRSPMLGASSAPTSFPRSTRCRRPTARRCTPSTSSCRTC